ncbi:MAG: Type III restriction enzyme, res subunit [Chloroflexi bacterium ADurb.Bin360]|nr:MAG: Type III restriction enzyme, res subunit [Chloroflexi bacterium ADurb.Bin360]
MPTLKEELDALSKYGVLKTTLPPAVLDNLNPALALRDYQKQALFRLMFYVTDYQERVRPTQLLFHMATGSGKTLIMAAAMLYLYQQGYSNFIFFVDSTTIIEKTRDNFLNPQSSKYLFAPQLKLDGQRIALQPVGNFQAANEQDINILFSTIQGLHTMLNNPRENALTYSDFAGQPIVLISDEAHHINALTKSSQQRNAGEAENINTWEATVNRIFQSHPDNLLLEFTATVELSHPAVAEKYRDKLLYDYPLKQFREDGYSKEVFTLQADLPQMARALQAVVISQYRKKVAERHGLHLKPVILMKSNYVNPPKTPDPNKVVSGEFRAAFEQRIAALTAADLAALRDSAQSQLVQSAFAFFAAQGISLDNLAREIQADFGPDRALSVDSISDSEAHQLLVNSLEAPDNPIRVVFAVEMLNEGWDVLNLFDIVRLYDTRDAKAGKPGKTTIAEAQLIGRGARYYPFQLEDAQLRFQRKFDDDLGNDLRVIEELYYHSAHNPRYIQELHTALVDIGIMPERQARQLTLNIKDSFKQSKFWEQGLLFTNERVRNDNADVFAIQDTLTAPRYTHRLRTGYAQDTALLDSPGLPQMGETHTRTLILGDFGVPLLRTALARLPFYEFRRLKTYFPHLASITEFITSAAYLGQVKIDVTGAPAQLDALSLAMKMDIALDVLRALADDVQRGTPTFRGTYEFNPLAVKACIKDRTINREYDLAADKGTGMRETANPDLHADLRAAEWYVYDENYGTSEEKALVKFIQGQIPALQQKYTDIYLLRNEGLFQIYDFAEGRPFEPDFVLFLTDRATGQALHYQLFIEPKGSHLVPHDQWKNDFLQQIENRHRITLTLPNRDFKVVGLPFYNTEDQKRIFENAFKDALRL